MHVHMQPGSPRISFSVTTSTPWPGRRSAQIWTKLNIFGIISKGSSARSVPDQQQLHNCSRPSSRLGATFPGQQLTDSSIPWDSDARLSLTPMEVIRHIDRLQVHVLSNRTMNYGMSKCFVQRMFCANFSSFRCNMHSRWLSQNWIKPALERNLRFFCCSVYLQSKEEVFYYYPYANVNNKMTDWNGKQKMTITDLIFASATSKACLCQMERFFRISLQVTNLGRCCCTKTLSFSTSWYNC